MSLPEGFRWAPIYFGCPEGVTVLFCAGVPVARLFERVDGTWFATLDYHLAGADRPRDCSSFEQGKAGVEIWATRHSERLKEEVTSIERRWAAGRRQVRV